MAPIILKSLSLERGGGIDRAKRALEGISSRNKNKPAKSAENSNRRVLFSGEFYFLTIFQLTTFEERKRAFFMQQSFFCFSPL